MNSVSSDGSIPVSQQALDRQHQAIRTSGWGSPFVFMQPRNACFWIYIGLTLVGAVQMWRYYSPEAGFYAQGLILAAIVCALGGLAWVVWLRHIDRWERQPAGLILAAILWGGVPATFAFAMTANTALLSIYPKLFGQVWGDRWSAGLAAPFTEESAKLCGFLLLMGLAPKLIRTANDGLIVGAFVGLGFAVFEDFLYAANAASSGFSVHATESSVFTAASRVAVSFISHPLFSALVCCGAVYLIGTRAQPRMIGRGALLVLSGVFLHFTWDDAAGLGFGNGLISIPIMIGAAVLGFALLSVAFRRAAPREHQLVRDVLGPEIEVGVLSDEELESVLSKKTPRASRRGRSSREARAQHRHFQQAVLDLAYALAGSDGVVDESVLHARREVSRLAPQRTHTSTTAGGTARWMKGK